MSAPAPERCALPVVTDQSYSRITAESVGCLRQARRNPIDTGLRRGVHGNGCTSHRRLTRAKKAPSLT